jgi:hypothetical protein
VELTTHSSADHSNNKSTRPEFGKVDTLATV